MTGSTACIVIGVVLVLAGTCMVGYQMSKVHWESDQPIPRSMTVSPTKGIALTTTYPGLIVIGIGAVMVMAGAAISNKKKS